MTLAENQNSTSTAKPAQSGVSVFSLDHFTSMQRMSPGVPLELCQGVTLSVLQDAAEGLLEINEAASAVSVSGKAAHELATVRAGEIIKTDVGRWATVVKAAGLKVD